MSEPDTRSEPDSTLDARTYDVLLPRRSQAVSLQLREIRSAVGWEGARALLTYASCVVVLASGLSVSLQTWSNTERGIAVIPLVGLLPFVDGSPEVSLSPYWMLFVVALGVAGWFLSGQVTKRWLRSYVVAGLVISVLLLITIGRNANFEQAASTARAEARRLLEADPSEEPSLTGAVLDRLCALGDLDAEACRNAAGRPADELDVADASAVRLGACLPGWTLSAFDQWLTAASFDRQVAAVAALASCEIGAVDPAAESAEGDPIEVIVVEATTVPDESAEQGSPVASAAETLPSPDDVGDAAEPEPPTAAAGPTVPGSTAVTEALRVQRSEVMTHEAIVRGADEILSFASGPSHFAEFRFSGAAWLILLAVALLWYRQLEIRAGAHRLGPIDVQFEPVGAPDGESSPDGGVRRLPSNSAEAVFKEAVIRNVPEPGAVPGSGALAPVGDLVAQSDLPQKRMASGLIEVLQTIFATQGGFTATCSVRSTDDVHAVFVRLRDTRTGNHLASYVAESEDAMEAARLAGYWIAGWIIHRSAYVPSWAQWSEDDAASFVKTGWEQGKEFALSLAGPFAGDLDDMGTVNSLILAQRAYAHQLRSPHGSNRLAALEDVARAVHRRPRYPVARYRRGAELGTMMLVGGPLTRAPDTATGTDAATATGTDAATATGTDPATAARESGGESTPPTPPPVTPSRVRYLFSDLLLGDPDAIDAVLDAGSGDGCVPLAEGAVLGTELRWTMLLQVARWSNENRAALTWRALARLRPSERFFWRSFARGELEKDWLRVLELERCTCAERLEVVNATASPAQSVPDEDSRARSAELIGIRADVERRALEPDSHWQLSYNLGCFYAIRSRRLADDEEARCLATALTWLERALDRPAISQLVREWVLADDDLAPLRTLPEFCTWTRRVPPLAREATPRTGQLTPALPQRD